MAGLSVEGVHEGLLTITEAQAFTRLSRSELYLRMNRGELAYCKLGKRRLIPRRALVELVQRGMVNPSSADRGSAAN